MSVGTIIVIIIAIVVLVFLIFSFTRSGGSLMDNIKNFFGSGTNVDTIKNACTAACSTSQVYEFCGKSRTINLDDKRSFRGSCSTLRTNVGEAGLESCPNVDCAETSLKDDGVLNCDWKSKNPGCGTAKDFTSQIQNSEMHDVKTEVCCEKTVANIEETGTE